MEDNVFDVEKSADLIYDFVLTGYDNMQKEQTYGEITLNMVLVHTLIMVYKNPGINVTQVSQMWGQTRSAASKNVAKLENLGLLEKRKMPDNQKELCLFATPQGENVARQHIEYDNMVIQNILDKVSCKYSDEQIENFFNVLGDLNEILKGENTK